MIEGRKSPPSPSPPPPSPSPSSPPPRPPPPPPSPPARYKPRTRQELRNALIAWCSVKDADQCRAYTQLGIETDVAEWDVSLVTKMYDLLSAVGRVEDQGDPSVFRTCNPGIGPWDVSSVTDMQLMFSPFEGESVFYQDLSKWDVSSSTRTYYIFYHAPQMCKEKAYWPQQVKDDATTPNGC